MVRLFIAFMAVLLVLWIVRDLLKRAKDNEAKREFERAKRETEDLDFQLRTEEEREKQSQMRIDSVRDSIGLEK